jgi:DNA-binding CsgD family transcriptional regulator/uncharacterized protein YjbI with pentapeptide repeats
VLKVLAYDTEQQSTSEPVEHSTIEQSAQATDRHHLDRLSPLESRVLARLTQGASTDQIASELETSPNWVHLRIRSIRNRLEVNSTAEAVALADRFAGERIVVAVQQLDDPQVAVRQGGLYALEQFAQNTPAQRQAVVNELCAYLRKPYQPPDGYPPAEDDGRTVHRRRLEEQEVRMTAERILSRHLRPGCSEAFWDGIDLDLRGATLTILQIEQCRISRANFAGATFTANARFAEATFTSDAVFTDATFTANAWFGGAVFEGDATFNGVTSIGDIQFDSAIFIRDARFTHATIDGRAWFVDATFEGPAGFTAATFNGDAVFVDATFDSDAVFAKVRFTGNADFGEAIFNSDADFVEAIFTSNAWFTTATFDGTALFDGATGAVLKPGMPPGLAARRTHSHTDLTDLT